MSASFRREEELFSSALALPAVERARYLARACGDDKELLARVTELLAQFGEAERCMERPEWLPAPPSHLASRTRSEEAPGDRIGPYQLLREIGEGGGGVVYLAEQSAPVRRQVALKIIKLGMDTRAVIARFEAERQALAMMDHPNIARVFEAGATPSGRPYFAMELVRGIKITAYCDQGRLSLTERLSLFIQTCYAVQHAHQKGIIHRDIKPSNVLVTLHDGSPLVKVIDFGIAKAVAERPADETAHTLAEQLIGTPAYMSPEQTQLGAEVDSRSDVYSLGVLLYELLTGCTPFDTADLVDSGFEAVTQRIREVEPPTPSRRVRSLDSERMTITAERRKLQIAKLVRLLHGDLDWIVMRCLEKERVRRYATVGDLVEDLLRYTRDEPIVTRPRRIRYVIGKFARRHRAVVAASAVAGAILLAATALSGWLAIRAMRAEALAQSEAASRQEVIDFLQHDLLAQASPSNEPDRDLKLRTVLNRAAEKIEGRFPAQPLVEADVRETLARTYDSLGEYAVARRHVEVALAISKRELGDGHEKTLALTSYLADLLMVDGEYAQAERLSHEVLQKQRRVLGPKHADTLESLVTLGTIQHQQGRFEEAAQLFNEALAAQRTVFEPEDPQLLVTMNNLALSYRNLGKFAQAVALHEQEYAISSRVLGAEHPDTLTSMTNLSIAYAESGRFVDAEALGGKALAISIRVAGAEHPETLILQHNQANTQLDLGNYERAERLQREALERTRKAAGEEHLNTIKAHSVLAMIYRAQGRLAEARKLLEQTLGTSRRVLGPQHFVSVIASSNLAWVYEDSGLLTQAEALLQDAVGRSSEVFGVSHPHTWRFADQRAGVLIKLQRYQEAVQLLEKSLAGRRRAAPEDWRTFSAQSQLGEALVGLHRYQEAEPLLIAADAGLGRQRKSIPAWSSVLRDSTARIERLHLGRGDSKRAATSGR